MKRAFTLVELLVVVGIVATLAAILFPVFAKAKSAAYSTVCFGNLKNISSAVALYAVGNDDLMPYGPDACTKWEEGWEFGLLAAMGYPPQYDRLALEVPTVAILLKPYGTTKSLWHCPEDKIGDPVGPDGPGVRTFFGLCGSSYDYDFIQAFNGRSLSSYPNPSGTEIIYEYEPFHGPADSYGRTTLYNVAYADLHLRAVDALQNTAGMGQDIH